MNPAIVRQAIARQQQQARYAAQPKSRLTQLPAPVGGINTRDALEDMPITDAVSMINMLPSSSAETRAGTSQSYLGVGTGDVLTLAEYWSGSTRKLLGASQTNIYDVAKAPPYTVNAVKFDGVNDYMLRGGALTGLTDAKVGSWSGWIKFNSLPAFTSTIFRIGKIADSADYGFEIIISSVGTIISKGANSGFSNILTISNTAHLSINLWYHVLMSWDLSAGTTNVYINNSSDKAQTTATNDTIDYTKTDCGFGASTDGSAKIDASVSEFWFTNTYIDFSSGTNRAKFIDANGLPVSLGADGSTPTGTAPIVYLKGNNITFGTNSGSGGDFTITGALSEASTSPTSIGFNLLGSQTSGRYQTANFMSNMLWVNGVDAPQVFGGSTFTSWTGSCSGMTTTNVIGCNVYRNRMWVWMNNDQNVFYSATQTIGGTYTKFPLADVGNFGGNLTAMVTWTHDGGNGVDDYAAFIMSSGDLIIYSGDPASTFSLVGIYRIPPPIGIRSITKFGGDVLIGTKVDYVLLSQVEAGIYDKPSKISGALKAATALYASNSGWQVTYWAEGGLVICNVPISTTEFQQHVLNILTGAWTIYEDINARCWGLYNGNVYFGSGDGSIYQAETGTDDNGSNISCDVQQAWNDGGYVGKKQVMTYRPVFTAHGALTYTSGIAYDYATVNVTQTSSIASLGAAWDTSDWDTADWSPETQIKQSWSGAKGIGNKISVRIRLDTNQSVSWDRTDLMSTPAGAL